MALASVMASACCSHDGAAEPGASSRAGASEPGASLVWDVQSDTGGVRILPNLDDALRVAFYHVGLLQSALNHKKKKRAQKCIDLLVKDVVTAFKKHKLQLLLLCELGEHEIGLEGRMHFQCDTQLKLMEMVTAEVNGAFEQEDSGAPEPAAPRVTLVAGEFPSYAAIKLDEDDLVVVDNCWHCGLDRRPHKTQGDDRTMLTLTCEW